MLRLVHFGLCLLEVGDLSQLNGAVVTLLSVPVDEIDWGLLFACIT